ncbi:MAG: DUF1501 domain-containing protein [Planctomycetota bacterium]
MMNFNRRQAIQTISTSFGSLAFAAMATRDSLLHGAQDSKSPMAPKETHFAPRAKNVIMLFMNGAPSHVDTFDYKPELIRANGSAGGRVGKMLAPGWKFRQRGESGLWISDLFPNLAEHADDLCLLRGMHNEQPNHPAAERAAHTGSAQFIRPSLGAWSVYGLGTENTDLPGFVVMGEGGRAGSVSFGSSFLPARYQATTVNPGTGGGDRGGRRGRGGGASSGEAIPNIANSTLSKRAQRTQLDLLNRLNQETLRQETHQPQVEGIMQSYELAFRMQASMPQLMDLSQETQATKDLYGMEDPASSSFGTQCLLARRMVESGVRFIEVGTGGWDHHTNLKEKLPESCAAVDKPIAGLLADLKQRDLLKDTLVIWASEFGRTPHATGGGRGHNNKGYTTWMAGGGVKAGFSYGATDELGYQASEGKIHTHDWHATILHLLGLDHKRLTYRHAGRDFRLTDVSGKVAKGILA